MARLDEIAEGVASVVAFGPQSERLPMRFRGHSPAEIAFLVAAVITACERAGRSLAYVRLPAAATAILKRDPEPIGGVRLDGSIVQPDTVEFRHFPIPGRGVPIVLSFRG